jgi:predicted PolB exonuclease-like 3'-5' exonuclease
MNTIMVYDLETIPDVTRGRRLLKLEESGDLIVAEALRERRLVQTQGSSSFLPPHLQQIVSIAVVVSTPEWVKVWSLGNLDSNESEIIARFFEGVQKYTPDLVSWNGTGFDLPVLHYRSLLHGVVASRYWETGDQDIGFKWNNYLGRYHHRHTDLMEVLAGYQSRAYAPMDEIALMLDLPGKMGMQGSEVWERYQAKDLQGIREYCERDVLNTYLIYLRFQYIRGRMDENHVKFAEDRLKTYLLSAEKPHLLAFLKEWEAG